MISEFNISEVEEISEHGDNLYQIMKNRLIFCNTDLTNNEDYLGPSDLCYLSKECKNKSFFGLGSKKVIKQGDYHFVYGLDTSNVAYISAYISKYLSKIAAKEHTNPSTFKTVQAIFCIFDYYIGKDLRMLVKFPGGVRSIYYIDGKSPVESETENLQTIFMSSLIRSLDARIGEFDKNTLFLEEITSLSSFNFMSECLLKMINKEDEFTEKIIPNLNYKIKMTFTIIQKYLLKTRRFSYSIVLFSKSIDLSNLKFVIESLNIMQQYAESMNLLATNLDKKQMVDLFCLEIETLLLYKKFDDAFEIAKYSSTMFPEYRRVWTNLSEVYLKKKQFDYSLRALNNIEIDSKLFNSITQDINFDIKKHQKSYLIFNEVSLSLDKKKTTTESNYYSSEKSDMLSDFMDKIMKSSYFFFDEEQTKAYKIMLDMIKEINFDSFVELKKSNFYYDVNAGEEGDNTTKISKDSQSPVLKINLNKELEVVIDTIISDLKIFSVIITQEESQFNTIFTKMKLSVLEGILFILLILAKFCFSIGILAERLEYYNTALKFYSKGLRSVFSKYILIRRIKIYGKLKDYNNLIKHLVEFLEFIPSNSLLNVNKTPIWIDKLILEVLSENKINSLVEFLSEYPKHIIEYITKKIANKYKYWIEKGQDIKILK